MRHVGASATPAANHQGVGVARELPHQRWAGALTPVTGEDAPMASQPVVREQSGSRRSAVLS